MYLSSAPSTLDTSQIFSNVAMDNLSSSYNGTIKWINNVSSNPFLRKLPQMIYYEMIGITALLTNGLLIYIILSRRKLWEIRNAKLCSMSVSGILFAILFCIPYPSTVLDKTSILCYLQTSLRNFLMSCICFHLALVAIDRAIIVATPFHYSALVNRRNTWICLIFVWVTAFVGSFYPVLTFRLVKRNSSNPCAQSGTARDELIYTICFYTLYYVSPLIVMLVCHGYTFFIALHHIKKINDQQLSTFDPVQKRKSQLIAKQFRAAKPVIIITGTFIILTVPYIICSMVWLIMGSIPYNIRKPFIPVIVNFLKASDGGLRELAFAYPAINPLLYMWFDRDICHEITETWKRPIVQIPQSGTEALDMHLDVNLN